MRPVMARGIARLLHWWSQTPYLRVSVAGLAGLGLLFILTLAVLGPFTEMVTGSAVRALSGGEKAEALNAVRQSVLAAFAGSAALIGLAFTARTYFLSRRGQSTQRFSTAVALLASERLEERIGGIYALEHLMTESDRDHTAIIAILCAFVRTRTVRRDPDNDGGPDEDAPFPEIEPPADVDAAVTVLARRPTRHEPNRPDLRQATLVGLSVREHDFSAAPRLTQMFLTGADLRRADFRGTDLRRSIVNYADLRYAWLSKANLTDTSVSSANLRGAAFGNAILTRTRLDGSDLRNATGLTAAQLSAAYIDSTSKLPPELAADPWVIARISDCETWSATHDDPWACPPPTHLPEVEVKAPAAAHHANMPESGK